MALHLAIPCPFAVSERSRLLNVWFLSGCLDTGSDHLEAALVRTPLSLAF